MRPHCQHAAPCLPEYAVGPPAPDADCRPASVRRSSPSPSDAVWRPALAAAGPVPRRLGHHGGGRRLAAGQLLFAAAGGGLWHSANAGRTWTSLFEQGPTASVGAVAIATIGPAGDLYRHRPAGAALRRRGGRRRVPLQRWRCSLDVAGAGRHQTYRQHLGQPARPGDGAGGSARAFLRPQPDARHLPVHRWRPPLVPDAEDRRRHRHRRHRQRPGQPRADLRLRLAGASNILGRATSPMSRGLAAAFIAPPMAASTWARARWCWLARGPARSDRPGPSPTPQAGTRLYAAIDGGKTSKAGGLYRSDDGGAHWSACERGGRVHQLVCQPAGGRPQASRTWSIPSASRSAAATTAARIAPSSRAPLAATIITTSGSIPAHPGPHHHRQRPGRRGQRGWRGDLEQTGTTSPPASSITSPPTTAFPTGSIPASRTAARSASPAAAITAF